MPSPKKATCRVTGHSHDALLIIDTITDLEFPGGEKVLPWAEKLAGKLKTFRARAHRARMPVIYVNDNFSLWHSNFGELYRQGTRRGVRGRNVSRKLKPDERDYFILKPMHSAFYSTSLVPLLQHLQIRRLILSGIATNLCVFFSAHDAHMRQYPMIILSDCCAAETDHDHDIALEQLAQFCHAKICLSTEYRMAGSAPRRSRADVK